MYVESTTCDSNVNSVTVVWSAIVLFVVPVVYMLIETVLMLNVNDLKFGSLYFNDFDTKKLEVNVNICFKDRRKIAPVTTWSLSSYHPTVSVSVGLTTEQVKVADLPDCIASPTAL